MNAERVGVVGATGAVGSRLLSILEERAFPVSELRPFASERSVGKRISFSSREWSCEALRPGCFKELDFVFFDVSDEISSRWVPEALESGAYVIDNSAVYRLKDDVPLVVPEVNAGSLQEAIRAHQRLVAGPNCSTVQLVLALKALQDRAGLKRVVVSTYQSVSGAGSAAMEELQRQVQSQSEATVFPHPIAFNLIPRIGKGLADGFTSEEQKLMLESRKILGQADLPIVATAIRVPTLISHAESVFVELDREISPAEARALWMDFPGVQVMDDLALDCYPMNLNTAGSDAVAIGRIRKDPSVLSGLAFWVVSDNLRKGAALNAVQIAESIRRFRDKL
jgi:aspartate-semialdehyde dehydrogenase